MKEAFDIYDDMPPEQKKYLRNWGWNFNKKACDEAVSNMKRRNPATGKLEKLEAMNKEAVEELLSKHNIILNNNVGYNFVYVANMAKADLFKSSIPDEQHLAMYVKDVIDDPDNEGGNVFRKYFADCTAKGIHIEWDDIL